MGRRVTKNDQRFLYDGYLQVADNCGNTYVWDPTEKVATRPLVWKSSLFRPFNFSTSYYVHDGNKNVSEVVAENGDIAAHYEYSPFGAVVVLSGAFASNNPWRFSCEYVDDNIVVVYYNFRHYNPVSGSWLSRDLLLENGGLNLYLISHNNCMTVSDALGLCCCGDCEVRNFVAIGPMLLGFRIHSMAGLDYSEVSLGKLLEMIGEDYVDALVKAKGSKAINELLDVFKEILKNVDVGSKVASLLISDLAHVMEVQLEIGTVYSYQRRDCKKKHWFSFRCTWSEWKNVYGTTSEWKAAPVMDSNNPLENQFAVEQLITDPEGVLEIIRNSIDKIIDEALENVADFGPDDVPEISKCKIVK